MFKGIDLFSDTLTLPSEAMKHAMMEASLGDEQKGEDPTTLKLEEMVAALLGQETALFVPSATMANEIAIRLLCEPGDELLAAEKCHLFFAEAGGPAVHSGVMARPIRTTNGIFTADDLQTTYRHELGPHYPRSKLLSIENTTNMGGGIAWNLETMRSVLEAAKELTLKTHLDGSRLFNAAIKTATPAKQLAEHFDTVTICLSKGLGCPVGAVLAFQKIHYEKVRRLKQLFGGAMRQSGMLAAAGIYALENNIDRLQEDHANANYLAKELATISQLQVENNPPSTNMVFFDWLDANMSANQFNQQCIQNGLRFSQVGQKRFRAVTHLGICQEDLKTAVEIIRKICSI